MKHLKERDSVCIWIGTFFVILFCLFYPGTITNAATPSGLSFGIGLGAHMPSDDDAYGNLGTDFYPDFSIKYDISGFRLGISLGYVYREEETYGYDYYGYYYYNYEMSFMPLKVSVEVLPVRFAAPKFVFQPYLGIALGQYIATGDNDENLSMTSFNGGFEFHFSEVYNLAFEVAYNNVSESARYNHLFGGDLNYTTVMLINRIRIPFKRVR